MASRRKTTLTSALAATPAVTGPLPALQGAVDSAGINSQPRPERFSRLNQIESSSVPASHRRSPHSQHSRDGGTEVLKPVVAAPVVYSSSPEASHSCGFMATVIESTLGSLENRAWRYISVV